MSALFQVITTAISGSIIGSLFFSLWLMGAMSAYVFLFGSYSLGDFFLGELTLEKPVFWAFVTGVIFGAVQGFLAGLIIGKFDIVLLLKSALAGFLVMEVLIFTVYFYFFVFDDPNPISFILNLVNNLYGLIKISLILFIPSILTGAAIAKAVLFFNSK